MPELKPYRGLHNAYPGRVFVNYLDDGPRFMQYEYGPKGRFVGHGMSILMIVVVISVSLLLSSVIRQYPDASGVCSILALPAMLGFILSYILLSVVHDVYLGDVEAPLVSASLNPLKPRTAFVIEYSQKALRPVLIGSNHVTLNRRETVSRGAGSFAELETHSDQIDVHALPVSPLDTGDQLFQRAPLAIPVDAMPTFIRQSNRIQYFLTLTLQLIDRPPYTEEYEIVVES